MNHIQFTEEERQKVIQARNHFTNNSIDSIMTKTLNKVIMLIEMQFDGKITVRKGPKL